MAGNNQQVTGLSNYVWSPKFGNTTGKKLYDPGVDYSAGNFSRFNKWAENNPNDAANWGSKFNTTISTGNTGLSNYKLDWDNNDITSHTTQKPIPFEERYPKVNNNPEPYGSWSPDSEDDYYNTTDGYGSEVSSAAPTSLTDISTSAGVASTGIPSFLTPTNTSAQWSGTLNGVTGNTSSVPAPNTMSLDDQLKQVRIDTYKKYLDELDKPAPTFLGMDRANVGLSMQGLGLASQLYSEFGPDGNRKLRKEQIGALKDDRNRANEEQQAIRDYRNSYK